MLYVSRRVGDESVGVVDTDDGIEEIHEINVLRWSLDGTDLRVHGFDFGMKLSPIIRPYQVPDLVTKEQAKLRTLFNIDTSVYKGILTNFICDSIALVRDVTISVSDICKGLGSCAFAGNRFGIDHGAYRAILVMDDTITFAENALCFPESDFYSDSCLDSYVAFDLREMRDIGRVRAFYKQAAQYDMSDLFSSLSSLIIDNSDRKQALIRWAYDQADELNSQDLEDEYT